MKFKEEEKTQIDIINTYKKLLDFKLISPNCLLYSNRNENSKGGVNGKISGYVFKRMGRVAGLPDLTFLYKNEGVANIAYIEVKAPSVFFTKKGTPTKSKGLEESQITFIDKYIKYLNIPFTICANTEMFINFLIDLGVLKCKKDRLFLEYGIS